jgi:hypothetical protein
MEGFEWALWLSLAAAGASAFALVIVAAWDRTK